MVENNHFLYNIAVVVKIVIADASQKFLADLAELLEAKSSHGSCSTSIREFARVPLHRADILEYTGQCKGKITWSNLYLIQSEHAVFALLTLSKNFFKTLKFRLRISWDMIETLKVVNNKIKWIISVNKYCNKILRL